MQNKVVGDYAVRQAVYPTGIGPGSLSANAPGVSGPAVAKQNARGLDSPVPRTAIHPDIAVRTKADENTVSSSMFGDEPMGVLIR